MLLGAPGLLLGARTAPGLPHECFASFSHGTEDSGRGVWLFGREARHPRPSILIMFCLKRHAKTSKGWMSGDHRRRHIGELSTACVASASDRQACSFVAAGMHKVPWIKPPGHSNHSNQRFQPVPTGHNRPAMVAFNTSDNGLRRLTPQSHIPKFTGRPPPMLDSQMLTLRGLIGKAPDAVLRVEDPSVE